MKLTLKHFDTKTRFYYTQWKTSWCNMVLSKVIKVVLMGQWKLNWAPASEFVSSSIPSWQILTAHAQPFRGTRDLAFCPKFPLDSLLVWASSGGSGETARMRRLAWTFAARIGDKYQIRLMWPNYGNGPKFWTYWSEQTVQTQIRLLRGAVWLGSTLFVIPSASFGSITLRQSHLVQILGWLQQMFRVSEFLGILQYFY